MTKGKGPHAELGGSDAPREMLAEDGVDLSGGDNADAASDGGPDLPQEAEPDLKDIRAASLRDDANSAG